MLDRAERAFLPSPQSGSTVPAPLGVAWRYVPSGPANPLLARPSYGALPASLTNLLPANLVTSAESLMTTLPWWAWLAGGAAVWMLLRGGHRGRAHNPRRHYRR
jgi:hypothetical protein